MRISVLTLFPEMFSGVLENSILKRGRARGLFSVQLTQIRDFALGRHRQVDDASYGGGPGMVLKPDVLARALNAVLASDAVLLSDAARDGRSVGPDGGNAPAPADRSGDWDRACEGSAVGGEVSPGRAESRPAHVVMMSPQGVPFTQAVARRFADLDHLVLICGHYEGVDERFNAARVDEEISLGDFVLTGGEIPALAVIDAVARLLPGVLGDAGSANADSFHDGLLDHPHYTRPPEWEGWTVPATLRSGDHGAIAQWRRRQALMTTLIRRPDLLAEVSLERPERRLIKALRRDLDSGEAAWAANAGAAWESTRFDEARNGKNVLERQSVGSESVTVSANGAQASGVQPRRPIGGRPARRVHRRRVRRSGCV